MERKTIKEEFKVEKGKYCKVVYIPKGYCEIKLEDINIDDVHISEEGKNVSVEILGKSYPCIKETK